MCRVLVRWKEKERYLADEIKYERAHSRRGDIIVVKPDGHVWGRAEGLPTYVSLDMEGVPIQEMEKFQAQEESPILTPHGKPFTVRKRAYKIDLDSLNPDLLDALRRDGKASCSGGCLKGRIIHKETGLRR